MLAWRRIASPYVCYTESYRLLRAPAALAFWWSRPGREEGARRRLDVGLDQVGRW